MYICNLVVNSVVEKVTEIFNPHEMGIDQLKARIAADIEGTRGSDTEPSYWPIAQGFARTRHWRADGAWFFVGGAGFGMLGRLDFGVKLPTFMERKFTSSTMKVSVGSNSVLSNLKGRSFVPNVMDNVIAPCLDLKGEEATLIKFVKEGRYVDGVVARLAALAVEHMLCPFSARTRARNASACYWCVARYRSDNITYSIQNVGNALPWSNPFHSGADCDPVAVVWVGEATHTNGMALLSRLYDAGGPIFGQRAHLLEQFDAGKLLMVGTGMLQSDLAPIEPCDIWDSISEALWILQTYNNMSPLYFQNCVELLMRNLAIVNTSSICERDPVMHCRASGRYQGADIDKSSSRLLAEQLTHSLGESCLDVLGIDLATETGRNRAADFFSETGRRTILQPPEGGDGFAPAVVHTTSMPAAAMLGALRVPHGTPVRNEQVAFARFDVNNIPTAPPRIPYPRCSDMGELWSAASGRSAYRIFFHSLPRQHGQFQPLVAGSSAVGDPDALDLPELPDANIRWEEYTGDARGANPVHMPTDRATYVVRLFVPTLPEQYQDYHAPEGKLRRFDLNPAFQIGVNRNGAIPALDGRAPRINDYLQAAEADDNPLTFLTEEGLRMIPPHEVGQRSLAFMFGLGYVWDAAHLGRTQNDAFGRWVRCERTDVRLSSLAEEHFTFVGGMRSVKYIEPACGLWVLCYLEPPQQTTGYYYNASPFSAMANDAYPAHALLKLRAAVEVTNQMQCASNARIRTCWESDAYNPGLRRKLARGRIFEKTNMDPATYLDRQSVLTDMIFGLRDSFLLRDFGVEAAGGFYVREARTRTDFPGDMVKYLNWLCPQSLPCYAWQLEYGIAQPSFILDDFGRDLLADLRYTTAWQGVPDNYKPGIFINKSDELWHSVLKTCIGETVELQTVEIAQFGTTAVVEVGSLRQHYSSKFVDFSARLHLPHETRLRSFLIRKARSIRAAPVFGDIPRPRAEDDNVWNVPGSYNAEGRYTPGDYIAAGCSVIDVRDTSFASAGVRLTSFNPTHLVNSEPHQRGLGRLWMRTASSAQKVEAGLCGAAHYMLRHLKPSVPGTDGTTGANVGVTGAGANVDTIPPPGPSVPAEGCGAGDVPLSEMRAELSNLGFLGNLDEGSRITVIRAFLKNKYRDIDDATLSTLTNTQGTPQTDPVSEHT